MKKLSPHAGGNANDDFLVHIFIHVRIETQELLGPQPLQKVATPPSTWKSKQLETEFSHNSLTTLFINPPS